MTNEEAQDDKFKNRAADILRSLEDVLIPLTTCDFQTEGAFIGCVKSALAKNYAVNRIIAEQKSSDGAFTLTAALRGLCEDIIFLRYVADFMEKRDEIIMVLLMRDMSRYMDKQRIFFEEYRPAQPLLGTKDMEQHAAECKRRLKDLGFDTTTNVETMAQRVGLKPLYDYLYAATSASVHFSPYTLMRMGWGVDKKNFRYSIDSFSGYYYHFNQVYGALLFILFCTRFASILSAKEVLEPSVDALVEILEYEIRWPEMITPEEMNQRKPSDLFYILGNSLHRLQGTPVLWTWADETE